MRLFEARGLTGESFYRTRRSEFRATLIVISGLAGFLYAGVAQVLRLVHGVRTEDPAFGLSDYLVQVIRATALGAIAGAAAAWAIGALWERWHRARRVS